MGGKKGKREQPTVEELIRKEDLKFKRLATKLATELVKKDEDVGRQMASKVFGFEIPDQEETSRSRLLSVLEEKAIHKLDEDPALADRVTDAYIRKTIGDLGLVVEGGELRKKPSFQDEIRLAREVKELKEAMGIKDHGILDVFMNPGVIIAFLVLLSVFLEHRRPAISGSKNGSVNEDGQVGKVLEGLIKLIAQYSGMSPGEVRKINPTNKGAGNTTPAERGKSGKPEKEDGATGVGGSDG